MIDAAQLAPTSRAEEVPVEGFAALARALAYFTQASSVRTNPESPV